MWERGREERGVEGRRTLTGNLHKGGGKTLTGVVFTTTVGGKRLNETDAVRAKAQCEKMGDGRAPHEATRKLDPCLASSRRGLVYPSKQARFVNVLQGAFTRAGGR